MLVTGLGDRDPAIITDMLWAAWHIARKSSDNWYHLYYPEDDLTSEELEKNCSKQKYVERCAAEDETKYRKLSAERITRYQMERGTDRDNELATDFEKRRKATKR
jgi:hypothetical protein